MNTVSHEDVFVVGTEQQLQLPVVVPSGPQRGGFSSFTDAPSRSRRASFTGTTLVSTKRAKYQQWIGKGSVFSNEFWNQSNGLILYRKQIWARYLEDYFFRTVMNQQCGKTLGCTCTDLTRCHGSAIISLLDFVHEVAAGVRQSKELSQEDAKRLTSTRKATDALGSRVFSNLADEKAQAEQAMRRKLGRRLSGSFRYTTPAPSISAHELAELEIRYESLERFDGTICGCGKVLGFANDDAASGTDGVDFSYGSVHATLDDYLQADSAAASTELCTAARKAVKKLRAKQRELWELFLFGGEVNPEVELSLKKQIHAIEANPKNRISVIDFHRVFGYQCSDCGLTTRPFEDRSADEFEGEDAELVERQAQGSAQITRGAFFSPSAKDVRLAYVDRESRNAPTHCSCGGSVEFRSGHRGAYAEWIVEGFYCTECSADCSPSWDMLPAQPMDRDDLAQEAWFQLVDLLRMLCLLNRCDVAAWVLAGLSEPGSSDH